MKTERIQDRGLLAKILETGLKVFLKKECNKIGKLKININSSSIQILKGIIQKIQIIAQDVNYKNLLFDKIELEAKEVEIVFNFKNKELKFKDNLPIDFNISLSEDSIKKILFSNNWSWIGDTVSNKILNQDKLEDLRIKNDNLFIKASNSFYEVNNQEEKIDIKLENGKIYLFNENEIPFSNPIQFSANDKIIHNRLQLKTNRKHL